MLIYLKLFYTTLLSNLVLPLSSEAFMQSVITLNRHTSVPIAFICTFVGGIVGFMINYEVVLLLHKRHKVDHNTMDEKKIKMNERYSFVLEKYLFFIGLISCYNPNIASILMIVFALSGKRQWKFILCVSIGYLLYLNNFANIVHL